MVDECLMSLNPLEDGYLHENTELTNGALLWFDRGEFVRVLGP